MKIQGPVLAVSMLTLIGMAVYLDLETPSPGPISAVHARVEGLSRGRGCRTCHGDQGLPLARACFACHEDQEKQIEEEEGFHGSLGKEDREECGWCHPEHLGEEFRIVGKRSFMLAGFEDREAFDHRGLHFLLEGRHEELPCKDCHPHADDGILAEGETRFLGLSQDCRSCHEDPHEGKLQDCSGCHGQERPFEHFARFQHDPRFPLRGSHGNLSCRRCHDPKDLRRMVDLQTPEGIRSAFSRAKRACADCHEPPHPSRFLARTKTALGLDEKGVCLHCHDPQTGHFHRPQARMDTGLHEATGFSLGPPHDRAECRDCHPEGGPMTFTGIYPGRKPEDCRACHGDPHAGRFGAPAFVGLTCLHCHVRQAFRPAKIHAETHGKTRFPLRGAHRGLECRKCHLPGEEVPGSARERGLALVFRGTPRECRGCHQDPHEGDFAGGAFEGRSCGDCHGAEGFRPSRLTAEDHRSTRFPLSGAHRNLDCRSCHGPDPVLPSSESRLKGLRFRGIPRRCRGCHEDPHRGQFRGGPFGAETCQGCHETGGFLPPDFTPEMHAKTRFPLTGGHLAVGCGHCHQRVPRPGGKEGSLRLFKGTSRSCGSCHEDVHGGSFDRGRVPEKLGGRTGCARCHVTESFSLVDRARFDHGKWTGYLLRGAHARAACRRCHSSESRGGKRTFGRAAKTCSGCHTDPHAGQFRVGERNDCGRCHRESAGFGNLKFDHERDSRFRLGKKHAGLFCKACHRTYRLSGLDQPVVRYRPMETDCRACHGSHRGPEREPVRGRGG